RMAAISGSRRWRLGGPLRVLRRRLTTARRPRPSIADARCADGERSIRWSAIGRAAPSREVVRILRLRQFHRLLQRGGKVLFDASPPNATAKEIGPQEL